MGESCGVARYVVISIASTDEPFWIVLSRCNSSSLLDTLPKSTLPKQEVDQVQRSLHRSRLGRP
jgi:hypothetical protein